MALSALLNDGKCRAADKAHRGKPTSIPWSSISRKQVSSGGITATRKRQMQQISALEFRAVLNDDLEERHRRHMLLRAWMQVKPRESLQ
jgi:hypothetical protein